MLFSNETHRKTAGSAAQKARKARFTLLELVIALGIMVALLTLLTMAGAGVRDTWARLNREQQYFNSLMLLDRVLDGILANAMPFNWRDADNQPLPLFAGASDRLDLACRHQTGTINDGGLRFASIQLDDDGQLLVAYTPRPLLSSAVDAGTAGVSVIGTGVKALEFQYADLEGGEIVWLDAWEAERLDIPMGILMTISWEDGRVESWLRRTAGNGFYERLGERENRSGL